MLNFSPDNIFSICLPYLPMHILSLWEHASTEFIHFHIANFKYHVMKIADDIQSDSEKWQLAN